MPNPWDNDRDNYTKAKITEVRKHENHTHLVLENKATFACDIPFDVQPGQTCELWTSKNAPVIRGVVIDGVLVQYRSQEEQNVVEERDRVEYQKMLDAQPKRPVVELFGRTFTHEMGEISGFGGGYETCLRAMVLAGVEHLSKNTGEFPKIGTYEGVTGIHVNGNKAAEELEAAILAATYVWEDRARVAREDCSGAQVQFAMQHSCIAHKLGWDEYTRKMIEGQQQREAEKSKGGQQG